MAGKTRKRCGGNNLLFFVLLALLTGLYTGNPAYAKSTIVIDTTVVDPNMLPTGGTGYSEILGTIDETAAKNGPWFR